MKQDNIGYLLILLIVILVFLLIYRQDKVEYFQDNTINLYNSYHLGDSIYTMIYFYNIANYLIDNNIRINFYINKQYIKQVSEFIPCDNIKIYDISEKPDNSIDTWINSIEGLNYYYLVNHKKMSYNDFLTAFFTKFGEKLNLPGLKELKYEDKDLLTRYENMDDTYKNIDILILNSVPLSGQYEYDTEKWNRFINKLNDKYNIVVSECVGNILCTRDNNLSIKDIAALSTHVKYVIAINSGPLAALFNTYTFKNVFKWYTFDNKTYFSFKNLVNSKDLDEIEKELL